MIYIGKWTIVLICYTDFHRALNGDSDVPDFIVAMIATVIVVGILPIALFVWKLIKYPYVRKNIKEFHDLLRKGLLH